jgi:SAM-dependent methyltransferase
MFRKKGATVTHAVTDPEPEPAPAPPAVVGVTDRYVRSAPTHQNAVDLFAGTWSSTFPAACGIEAGSLPLFEDPRIQQVLAHFDSVKNTRVLELGPLEGGHTFMFHEAGVARIIAVEASALSFLKCLVTKEILHLNRAHFLLGDFNEYLDRRHDHFDIVLASGVLHHSAEPLRLLEQIAAVTDQLAIWTHYWERGAVERDEQISRMFLEPPATLEWRGGTYAVHPRRDRGTPAAPTALWLERDGLIAALGSIGLRKLTVLDEERDHVNGPAILLIAQR